MSENPPKIPQHVIEEMRRSGGWPSAALNKPDHKPFGLESMDDVTPFRRRISDPPAPLAEHVGWPQSPSAASLGRPRSPFEPLGPTPALSPEQIRGMLKNHNPSGKQSGGLKYDAEKPPMDLIDRRAMEQLANVLAFGAKKYAAHNWRSGIQYSRLTAAALRHIHAFNDGETFDPESGLPHIAHAMCCLMFILGQPGTEMDDRHRSDE